MGMKDKLFIDKISPTFIALTAMAIHHCLSAWIPGEFGVPPEFDRGGGAQHMCDTRNINHALNNACTDVFRRLDPGYHSSSPDFQARKLDDIRSMIC
jgi:hypothetical protein